MFLQKGSRNSLVSFEVPFPPASINDSSPFSSTFSLLCPDPCYLLLVFSPLIVLAYLPFFICFVSPLLYKANCLERTYYFF